MSSSISQGIETRVMHSIKFIGQKTIGFSFKLLGPVYPLLSGGRSTDWCNYSLLMLQTAFVTGIFAVGLFSVGHFAVGRFAVRTLRRTDTLP